MLSNPLLPLLPLLLLLPLLISRLLLSSSFIVGASHNPYIYQYSQEGPHIRSGNQQELGSQFATEFFASQVKRATKSTNL